MLKVGSLKQSVTFKAPPTEVYALIMDEKRHAAFTDSDVVMSVKINGKFRVFDGYCTGHNIELVEGKKIVQAWHFMEDGWPEDHYSICTFVFDGVGNKTKLNFLQKDIPKHKVGTLKRGWKDHYWRPMKEFLKNKQHV